MDDDTGNSRASVGYAPIDAYAVIGDCRAAALVCRDGAIDWLCWPRFDSPAIFAAILDARDGGTFLIRPVGDARLERRYLPDTNIVETTFHTQTGSFVLRDLMTVAGEADKDRVLVPEHEILREIEGLAGSVEIEVVYAPRPDYGRRRPRLERRGKLGIWCDAGGALYLRSEIALDISADGETAAGRTTIAASERRYVSLGFASDGPAVIPPLGDAARERIERTADWWRRWTALCRYKGPYREAVVRSALTLKLLAFAPSGAIVAAPTTSLPEQIGGDKNWDYRYCWLRDASFTVRALYALGYGEEAEAFINWTLHATRLSWPDPRILYDVYGRAPRAEARLDHLQGYAGSSPVRTGNGAEGQFQLDVYGELIDAAWQLVERGGRLDSETTLMLHGLGETVCRRWREPDSGIWEPRGPRQHHTHSKVLAWVALDRLIAIHRTQTPSVPTARFEAERQAIRDAIEQDGFNHTLGAYTGTFGGAEMDASVLTLPLYGYTDADDPRMRATWAAIVERLGDGALVYRYLPADGQPDEGAFAICAFWAIECQARSGDVAGATERFERLLCYANDVGLLAEEIDPSDGAGLGNIPQGFSHVGLINAALALASRRASAAHGLDADEEVELKP